jgi:hypothetical protein
MSDISQVSEKYDIFAFSMGISENYQGENVAHFALYQTVSI